MSLTLIAAASAALAADGAPSPEGRDLLYVDGTTLDGSGPGGGLFVGAGALAGDDAPSVAGTAVAGWTVRPVRLAVEFPVRADADAPLAGPPRLNARIVLADRRRLPLGVAGDLDFAVPWVPGEDPRWRGRVSLAVGHSAAMLAVNFGVEAGGGVPVDGLLWAVGGGLPLVGPLTAFAEVAGGAPVRFDMDWPAFGLPVPGVVRGGLHLTPVGPLVVTVAIAEPLRGTPGIELGALWIPPRRLHAPRTEGFDRDGDGIGNLADACPSEKEDFDGGNDVDGCPDGGATGPAPDGGGG